MSINDALRTIRERILITHQSAFKRSIVHEITLFNPSEDNIQNVFLDSSKFMPGLLILNESNEQLVFYTNVDVRNIFRAAMKEDFKHQETLQKMDRHELFIIWIRLSEKDSIRKNEPKIIKLYYEDNSHPPTRRFLDSFKSRRELKNQNVLFSIPHFNDEYSKPQGRKYDTFYVVSLPENNILKYQINKKVRLSDEISRTGIFIDKQICKEIKITEQDGLYENLYRHSLSVRRPPLDDEVRFNITYEVAPDDNEKHFFTMAVFSLIGLSLIFTLIGLKIINYNHHEWLFFLKPIQDHLNTLLGGIITISLAAIGLIKDPFMNRTRFWFVLPILISAICFLTEK